MAFKFAIVHVFLIFFAIASATWTPAFDPDLYDAVLDPEECDKQLRYIRNNDTSGLRIRFMDASWRIPRNILKGNTRDLGGYYECLEISEHALDMAIGGKYCAVQFPLNQENFELPTIPEITWPENWNITSPENWNITWPENWNITWPELPTPYSALDLPWLKHDVNSIYNEEMREKLARYKRTAYIARHLFGDTAENTIPVSRTGDISAFSDMTFELAICMPKVCTTKQALDFFTNNLTSTMTFDEQFCRLPDDKPWVAADTVAVAVLSIIGLITLLSSAYDIRHSVLLGRDPKKANKIYQSFSIYTNTKNFFVFPSGPGIVTCLDGIRTFAMIWVIVGHTFVTQLAYISENPLDIINFIMKFTSLWITSGTITVDTFFTISGLLVVYTTAAKVSRRSLIKNLHLFYLNRLLRMFPVLAFGILMTASFLHRTTDGPYFNSVANFVNNCRANWWSSLLYVQNFVHPGNMCLPHSWYLAIDMQLHILSPAVLFWVLGNNKKSAWFAMVTALFAFVAGSSVYNFINNFQSATVALGRPNEGNNYLFNYYVHTLPRAAPFFVGMIFGYLMHLYRAKSLKMPMVFALFCWVLAFAGTTGVVITTYWNIQPDWDNQLMDNIFNSYKRPVWAASIGWLIFACHNGYGGPINWILSIHAFKIMGRMSYAMYILHYPLVYLIIGTTLAPVYFSVHFSIYRFIVDFVLAVVAGFFVTILIDFPFSNLIKMFVGGGSKRKPVPKENPSLSADPELDFKSVTATDDEKKTKL